MFLNKIRNMFCVPDTKFVTATNVARAGKRGNICVGNNVSSFASTLKHKLSSVIFFQINTLKGNTAKLLLGTFRGWTLLFFSVCDFPVSRVLNNELTLVSFLSDGLCKNVIIQCTRDLTN